MRRLLVRSDAIRGRDCGLKELGKYVASQETLILDCNDVMI